MLNILPTKTRDAILKSRFVQQIRRLAIFIVVFFLVMDGIMLGSYWLSTSWLDSLQQGNSVANITEADRVQLQQRIDDVKTIMADTTVIAQDFQNPLATYVEIVHDLPENIAVSEVTINYQTKTLLVSGQAATREDFIALQNTMQAKTSFENFNFPLSDLTVKENIAFTFSASLADETN